jgi:hypothetical protein
MSENIDIQESTQHKEVLTEQEMKEFVSKELEKKSKTEIINEYLEQNRVNILALAEQLRLVFGDSWFIVQNLRSKTKFKTIKECYELLTTLKLAGYLVTKRNEKKKREEYSIVLSKSDRLLLLRGVIQEQEVYLLSLKKEESKILEEIELEQKKQNSLTKVS